jgi:hypothetical protein
MKKRDMKLEEEIAEKFLISLGIGTPKYEVFGNSTPDFSINMEIAIEVTRLTQSNNTCENSLPFINPLKKILHEINSHDERRPSKSTYVNLEFTRPLPESCDWKKLLEAAIHRHIDDPAQKEVVVCKNATLSFVERSCSSKGDPRYWLMHCDMDEGGEIEPKLRKALENSINSKADNASKRKGAYREWWLVLVDFNSFCEEKPEQEFAFDVISRMDTSIWNKIILLNGHNSESQVEYPSL